MTGEIAVVVGGSVQWRFVPIGAITADEILTPRIMSYPPVPVGANLLLDGAPLGTVRCVRREQFSRWTVVFDPVVVAESISQEIPAVGTPISALAAHLDPRVVGTVEQLASSVEALAEKTDEALRAIDGIGPKRLLEIRAACAAVLNAG